MAKLLIVILSSLFIVQCGSSSEQSDLEKDLIGAYNFKGKAVFELTSGGDFIWNKGDSGSWYISEQDAFCVSGNKEFISNFCESSDCPEAGIDLCLNYKFSKSSDELTLSYPDDKGFEVETYKKGTE